MPGKSQYYNYYDGNEDVIKYLDGQKLVRLSVGDLKTIYDARKPYMEKKDYINFFGESVARDIVIHLEKINK